MTETLIGVAAVAAALLACGVAVFYLTGVPLLCHLGLHRWRREVAGRCRDARHVVRCGGCQALKDEE